MHVKHRMAVALVAVICAMPAAVLANDLKILVAPSETQASERAAQLADGKAIVAEPKLFKAFERAASHLAKCGGCTVTLQVAAGHYTGKAGTGTWSFPEVVAPSATLRILGGYDDVFTQRTPFSTPSVLVTADTRSAPVLTFEGKKHALAELVLSGFVFDVGAGNRYDKQHNSLVKGASSTWVILAFGYLTTNRLVVSDNVFMNAAHGVGGPLVRAASAHAEVIVDNNLFVNNVFTWQVKAAPAKQVLKRYIISHNSFVLGWPANLDATTSNPGTLEIGNKDTAGAVEIRGNLFAYCVGGAIFPAGREDNTPRLTIRDNLFWGNGGLFQPKSEGDGAVVGKFNRSGRHAIFDTKAITEDFSWDVGGNVVIDPALGIPVLKLTAVSDAGHEQEKEEPTGDEPLVAADINAEDVAADGKIENYTSRTPFQAGALPFPKNDQATKYGAAPARVKQY